MKSIDTLKPNVLFVLSDQHGYKFMGNSGHHIVNTPNLDKIASKSVNFSNCYCQNPLCAPSRASMLAGKYSKNIGIYENRHILESNSLTLPRLLSKNGYKTCVIGKTHFNGDQFHGYQQRPYGDLFGQAHQPDPARTPDLGFNGLGDVLGNSGESKIPLPLTQTEICVSESVKWLQTYMSDGRNEPFFLSVNFDKPHFPMRAPKKFIDNYLGKVELPDYPKEYLTEMAVPFVLEAVKINGEYHHYNKDEEIQKRALASYYACIEWVDDAVGRIVDTLDYLGLGENTIIIYSSDHGEMASQKGFWQKTVFFDNSAKVPLIIRMPEKYRKYFVSDQLVGLVDVFPTICELSGIEIPEECDGISLASVLLEKIPIERDHIFSETVALMVPEHAGCMLRKGDYKFNYYLDGNHELYNLKTDPDEWKNLYNDEDYNELSNNMKCQVIEFWEPDKQIGRYLSTPCMKKQKDQYFYSNQFLTADGRIIEGRP